MDSMPRVQRALLAIWLIAASLAAACAPAAGPTAGGAGQPAGGSAARSPALQALIDTASREGQVSYADTGAPEILAEQAKRFNERFGTNIAVELVPLRATETSTRLRQEIAAGKVTVDVIHPSSGLVYGLIDDKVDALEPFDWVGTFGDTLPEIGQVVERVPEVARGRALEFQHLVRAMVYNKNLVPAANVPKSWDDLLDARWKGKRLAIDPQGSSSYQHVARWDDARVLDYSRKLAAQDPLWVGSTINVARAVGRGEALVGITAVDNILDLQREGEPVELAPTEFYPATQQLVFPVKGSPHVNAARLWTAWLVTEGIPIAAALGQSNQRAWPDSNSEMARKLVELKGDLAMLSSQSDLERADRVRTQIVDEYKRLGAR
jgi:iron(III) transport system substrate-binding protein